MKLITGGAALTQDGLIKTDILIDEGRIVSLAPRIKAFDGETLNAEGLFIFPGFTDVHTHLREPGFFYKESILTGTKAAARGGFTTVFAMPNLNPCPDCYENLLPELDLINRTALISVKPYGAITKGENGAELSDMASMSDYVCGFSDDGKGVQSDEMMEKAMFTAHSLGKIIAAHCEVNSLLRGGYINAGKYAADHGHRGICSESEYLQIARDVEKAKKTGCRYHVCHVSTRESVEIIRKAKADGVNITCETAPHYLTLDESCLQEDGRFKMNPPLRAEEDRLALIDGLKDGTIDVIATDHAPHSAEEKSRGLKDSAMGIVGLETAFPVLFTELVRPGIISLETLVDKMSGAPNGIFGVENIGIKEGNVADLCAFDLDKKYKIDSMEFQSKGKSTPFEGKEVYGRCKFTMSKGRLAWQE